MRDASQLRYTSKNARDVRLRPQARFSAEIDDCQPRIDTEEKGAAITHSLPRLLLRTATRRH